MQISSRPVPALGDFRQYTNSKTDKNLVIPCHPTCTCDSKRTVDYIWRALRAGTKFRTIREKYNGFSSTATANH
jgi:hypothetical protein